MPIEPARPLGKWGMALWDEWISRVGDTYAAELLTLCETTDEHVFLRSKVFREALPADRQALRTLDQQLAEQLDAVKRAAAWVDYATSNGG